MTTRQPRGPGPPRRPPNRPVSSPYRPPIGSSTPKKALQIRSGHVRRYPGSEQRFRCPGRRCPAMSRQPSRSGRQDSNLRPPGPQPGALPDCATPRGAADSTPTLRTHRTSVRSLREHVFVSVGTPAQQEPADAATERSRAPTSPGAERAAGNATTTAAHAEQTTNERTTPRTATATSRTRSDANRRWSRSERPTSSSCSANARVRTVARPTRWSSSSTTSDPRTSVSPPRSATAAGSRSSTRSTRARWFVQTVIVGEPPCEAGSRARR